MNFFVFWGEKNLDGTKFVACEINRGSCGLNYCLTGNFIRFDLGFSNVHVAGSDDVGVVCNVLKLTVDRICNTCEEVDESLCNFFVGCFEIENNGAMSEKVVCDLGYACVCFGSYNLEFNGSFAVCTGNVDSGNSFFFFRKRSFVVVYSAEGFKNIARLIFVFSVDHGFDFV